MNFLFEIWPITLTAIFVFLLVFVGLMYRLPHASTPENMWQQASRYQLHYPGLKGTIIKYLFRFALVAWPAIALLNALFVFKVI
jgi:hypothetical protein